MRRLAFAVALVIGCSSEAAQFGGDDAGAGGSGVAARGGSTAAGGRPAGAGGTTASSGGVGGGEGGARDIGTGGAPAAAGGSTVVDAGSTGGAGGRPDGTGGAGGSCLDTNVLGFALGHACDPDAAEPLCHDGCELNGQRYVGCVDRSAVGARNRACVVSCDRCPAAAGGR